MRAALPRLAVPVGLILVLAELDRQPLLRGPLRAWREPLHLGLVAAGALLAAYGVRAGTRLLEAMLTGPLDAGHAAGVAKATSVVCYALVAAMALTGIGFNLSGLFLGGALGGIVVGMAAQTSLANVVAGAVILAVRPYRGGSWVRVDLGSQEYRGQVADMGLVYTRLENGGQEILVPNSAMVGAVLVLPPVLNGASDDGERDAGR